MFVAWHSHAAKPFNRAGAASEALETSRNHTISRDPLGGCFQGSCRMVRVYDEVSSSLTLAAELKKDSPVTQPRRKDDHTVVVPELIDEHECLLEGCWWVEDSVMRNDPKTTAQCELRHCAADR